MTNQFEASLSFWAESVTPLNTRDVDLKLGLARSLLYGGHADLPLFFRSALLPQRRLRFPNKFKALALQEERLLRTRRPTPKNPAVRLSSLRPKLQFTVLLDRLLAAPK